MKNFTNQIQIMIIEWMKDGLTENLAKSVKIATYYSFLKSISKKNKKPFSADEIWNSMLPRQRDHMIHCVDFLKILDQEITDRMPADDHFNEKPKRKRAKR